MTTAQGIPAAQYLRMSTEHQQYSLQNQSDAIRKYAERNGFEIVRTYSDAARSGVVLRSRAALQQLLQDVISGVAQFRAILVYDVSRWGRFQDTDESAHYEFLCKQGGAQVHYCAETFANDGSLPSLVMKALKRTMAGEYSRELGEKVFAGQSRLARLGLKQGGTSGYGLRRLLISADRTPKQLLAFGERKSLATDRVILVPGPPKEVAVVREIYRMFVKEHMTISAIAKWLNHSGIQDIEHSGWDHRKVKQILTHPKYIGCHTYNRTTTRLYTPKANKPESEWIVTPGAFQPIVDEITFDKAQRVLASRTISQSDTQILDGLRRLLARKGRLSWSLINEARIGPSTSTLRYRFGGVRRAYELIGYGKPGDFSGIDQRRRTEAFRIDLIRKIIGLFPEELSLCRRNQKTRAGLLLLRTGEPISVVVANSAKHRSGQRHWRARWVPRESDCVTLLVRLDANNRSVMDLHLFPKIEDPRPIYLRRDDARLSKAWKLNSLSEFWTVFVQMQA